jgi:peptidyl-prolyl cis-trans isomerase D
VQAIEVEPARTTSLADARNEIARELLSKERGRALALQQAQAALDAVKRGRSLSDLFPAKGGAKLGAEPLVASDTPTFRASDATVPSIGPVPGLREDALAASAGQPLPKVYEGQGALVVATVKTRERPDPAKFDAQRASIAERLEGKREAAVIQSWTAELASRARIVKNPIYLDAVGAGRQP